jgi:hypothetical protein
MRPVKAAAYGTLIASATAAIDSSLAFAGGATHDEFDIAGAVFPCPDATYTVVSGTIKEVFQEVESHSGNRMFTVTDVPRNVVLVDQTGARYTQRGATWFGGVTNDNAGAEVIAATHSLLIVTRGGVWRTAFT